MPDYYDTATQLNEYLVFHYGNDASVLPWDFGPVKALGFHNRLVGWVDKNRLHTGGRALDLGCAVGRISFELARTCESVVGVDYSTTFVESAKKIKESGLVAFQLTREGNLSTSAQVRLPSDLVRERVSFCQGDAENLPVSFGKFDVIIMANLLDRVGHPRKVLSRLRDITRPGAQVIICSPFTWWDEFTEPEERLGGFIQDGKEVTSMDTVAKLLEPDFHQTKIGDEPFLIRQHERKFFMSVACVGLWIRR